MAVMLLEWVFTSAFLILVVLILRAALGKRMSARLRYALWAVVLVRLLVPVQLFTSPLAGTRIFSESRMEQDVVDWPSVPAAPNAPDNTLSLGGQEGPSVTLSNFPQAPNPPIVPDAPEPPAAPDLTKAPAWLGWVWLAGSAAVALVLLVSNLRFYWRLRQERIPLEQADCPLRVYAAVGLPSPCLFGMFRPAIYVTPEAAADPAMLRHVLTHEYTHYRHGDHIWSLLRCGALAAHWWDPLVWLAAVLSQRDAELACDEGALKRLGDGERAGYGNTLLALVTAKPRPADLLRCATTMAGDKKSLKERISRIAKAPKRVIWAVVVAVLVTALACVCAFGQAAEPEEADGPEPDPTASPTADLEQSQADLTFDWDGSSMLLVNGKNIAISPDLNRNGVPETVTLGRVCYPDDADKARESTVDYEWNQALLVRENGEVLWYGIASDIHVGETSFLLYSKDGEDYLMEFDNHGGQGQAYAYYRLFTLENGVETTVRENHVEYHYCTDSLASVKDHFDPEAVAAFVDEVDGLLADCTLLVDTGYNYRGNQELLQVDMTWLAGYAPGFHWDDSQTTLENLVRFKMAAEHPLFARDMNRNMKVEMIRVTELDSGIGQRVELWEDDKGTIWAEEGYFAHAGWNALFLCTLDDKDYLLRYHPTMYQGFCNYEYQLFTLSKSGEEQMIRENGIEFDINFHPFTHQSFDPDAIAGFMDEINGLLANSVQLINTDENLLSAFEKEGRLYDSLWFLDTWEPIFTRDESKSLLENLRDFKAVMEAEWYAEEPVVFHMNETETNAHILLRYQDKSTQFDVDCWEAHFQPERQVQEQTQVIDLNGDGREEIVFPLVWGHGTGAYIEKLYVFDAETLEQYDTSGLNELILNQFQSTSDENNFYLNGAGMDVTIPKSEAQKANPYAPMSDAIGFDMIIRYTIEDGKVFCWLGCDASTGLINYIGCINVPVRMTPSGSFACGQAQYTADAPFL
ncbi:MAG: M56 family metallopeptidase [Clostridiales bacterium]|nr:M56 family metallopeptidase [Clostridiales bacterium]